MFERAVDKRVYEEELLGWLPERIIDCHVHIGLPEFCGPMSEERLRSNWAMEVGAEQSWEQWRASRDMLFPRQKVAALTMGVPFMEMDLARNNAYVLAGAMEPANDARALFVTRPEWDPERIEEAISRGFVGIKPYPDLAPHSDDGPGIFDFLPKPHLETLDRLGGVLMLHIPRAGRLADPDNIREIIEISESYPNVKMIVAHIGRSFCLPTAQRGLRHFVAHKNVLFDIACNLHPDVFVYALETIGPERLLYGSDLPITLMRGVREHLGETYINYTDGDYSWNVNRKSKEEEANYTYFLYEELRALVDGVRRAGLGRDALQQIMYANSVRLIL